jgi:SAM-dependent methyltransferase
MLLYRRPLRHAQGVVRPGSIVTRSPTPSAPTASRSRPRSFPPDDLIWRVTGTRDRDHFDSSGGQSLSDIRRALASVGTTLERFHSVLDFGCGCGRVLRWLAALPHRAEFVGCDIDAETVKWARDNIRGSRVVVNDSRPPLPFAADTFDLVYNHSVFTHLPEDYQDAWLAELSRVTKPGGTLLLSVAGDHPFAGFVESWHAAGADPSRFEVLYRKKGLVYIREDSWQDGPFPDFYHSTFHAPWYVFEHWKRFFEIRSYLVRGALEFQDLVVLEPLS